MLSETLTNYAKPSSRSGRGGRRPGFTICGFASRFEHSRPAPKAGTTSADMLALSTYMGHTHIRYTYWYLQATPVDARYRQACECFLKAGAP
jgi:hypothetical protein